MSISSQNWQWYQENRNTSKSFKCVQYAIGVNGVEYRKTLKH